MSWAIYDFNDDDEMYAYHIVPVDDDEPHDLSRKCRCIPNTEAVDEMSTLIIHNSFDGREGYEQAIDIINQS
jgi:hypothetical protein